MKFTRESAAYHIGIQHALEQNKRTIEFCADSPIASEYLAGFEFGEHLAQAIDDHMVQNQFVGLYFEDKLKSASVPYAKRVKP